jgi:hypothetical protein
MVGLTQNFRRTFGWMLRLATGRIQRLSQPPGGRIPMRSVDGGVACHASTTTEQAQFVTLTTPRTAAQPAA